MTWEKWHPRPLDELGFVGRGKSRHRPRNDARLYGGPYPFIQTADIMAADPYITTYSQTYSEFGLQQSKTWPPNTLCMTIAGANTAKTAILKFEACFPDSVVGFIPDGRKSDLHFVKYSLDLMRHRFLSVSRGATQDNLSLDKLLSFPILVPDIEEQRRIAGILSAYDKLIENNQRRIKILESMARALYREWFVDFRFPGHESVPRVPSTHGDIPRGWEVKTVRQVAGLISRGPSLSYVDSGGVQVVNQRCIRNEEIEMQAVQYAAPLSEKKSHLYLQPRDVLINSMGVGTLGRVSRNLSIDEPTIIHNCITVVRARTAEPTTAFLYYRLSDCQEHFESLGVGATGQTSLRIETIEDVQFALPPFELLTAFEQVALPMWTQVGVLKREIQNLRRTRDLLLPRLLSGRIDVEAIVS